MDLNFDTEHFIEEIRKRAALWDFSSPEYKDREMKRLQWHELCEVFHPEFEGLTAELKSTIVKEIQGKWKHIRDCYIRSERLKSVRARQGKKLCKKYIYARHLEFLDGVKEARESLKKTMYENSQDCVAVEESDSNDHKNYVNGNQDGSAGMDADKTSAQIETLAVNKTPAVDKTPFYSVRRRKGYVGIKTEQDVSTSQQEKKSKVDEADYSRIQKSTSVLKGVLSSLKTDGATCSGKGESSCDDMDFFRSLLPLIKPLPLQDKIKLRMDIMNVALKYYERVIK